MTAILDVALGAVAMLAIDWLLIIRPLRRDRDEARARERSPQGARGRFVSRKPKSGGVAP